MRMYVALLLLIAAVAAFASTCSAAGPETTRRVFDIDHFPVRIVEQREFRFDPATGDVLWGVRERREPYRLTLDGLVKAPAHLTYAELRALPQTAQKSDFHCVEGWDVLDVPWSGVRFHELFKRVEIAPEARFAVFHAMGKTNGAPGGLDHYVVSFPLDELLDPRLEYLLALDMDGRPLRQEYGAPARVVCPFDLAYKSIMFVERIEFSAERVPGWWTRANSIYPSEAPVPPGRLRRPDPRAGQTGGAQVDGAAQ